MPGISLLCSKAAISAAERGTVLRTLALMQASDRYQQFEVFSGSNILLGFTAYPQYPRTIIAHPQYCIFVEGCIYNKASLAVERELSELAKTSFAESTEPSLEAEIRNWLLSADGEYAVVMICKASQELILFNDALGQLPLYYQADAKRLYLSREMKFIVTAADNRAPDRVGIAQFLMSGFNLGNRTLSQNIERLPPASILRFAPGSTGFTLQCLHQWNLAQPEEAGRSLQQQASILADRFTQAVRDRVATIPNLKPALAMSGGLDSRAVLAALTRAKLGFSAHTCRSQGRRNLSDVETARSLSACFACDWREYRLTGPSWRDIATVVRNQDGAGNAVMAVAVDHYRQLINELGEAICLFTGDAGNQVMYPLKPLRRIKSMDHLVAMTCDATGLLDLETVCRLLKISKSMVRDDARAALESYPEQDWDSKYRHYRFIGRGWRFVMEGEDRTRFFMWLAAPFWDLRVIQLALQTPDSSKQDLALYRLFLEALDRRTLEVKCSDYTYRLSSPLIRARGLLRRWLAAQPWLYRRARAFYLRETLRRNAVAGPRPVLQRILAKSELLQEYFDGPFLKGLLSRPLSKAGRGLLTAIILRTSFIERGYPFADDE